MTDPSKSLPGYSPAVPNRRVALSFTFVASAILTLALAGAWIYVARDFVGKAIEKENRTHITRARTVFEVMRKRTQNDLRVQCRVLAEDPRLKATLATEGIDEATVADILKDLSLLRGSGFIMVLSPEGRVFAQAGAEELRGLDLSASSVVQKARSSEDAVVGSWVIGRTIMDLGAMPIRFDTTLIAYLVVGEAIDKKLVTAVADATGVAAAIGIGTEISIASTDDPKLRTLFLSIANDVRNARGQVLEADGEKFVTAFIELEQSKTRPHLVLARTLEASSTNFKSVNLLLWIPPALVLIALLISRMRSKQLARMPRAGGV